jgi:Ca2+-binding RTX toxin-like protein
MTTTIEYALMAGASYISTRTEINQFPVSSGWTQTKHANPQDGSGFEAVSFINGATLASSTEIVISYAGTYDKDFTGDKLANVGLAMGTGSTQLLQAIEYYLQVKAANPDVTITLIGHSLGGGLAALVGVFFGVQTQTFDQAPFAQTARFKAPDVMAHLLGRVDAAGNPLYSDAALAPLRSYIDQKAAFGVSATLIPNEGLVNNINVQGEFLSDAPWTTFSRIGTTSESIGNTAPMVSGFDLHSQALLAAFLQSRQMAATVDGQSQSLSQVTYKLSDLLPMIFDAKLFAYRSDDADNRDFLAHLVRHEAGVKDVITPDAMVTRFTKDLWKLAQDGGLTMRDGNPSNVDLNEVSKTLMAFAMQKYYEEQSSSPGVGQELFNKIIGGIAFDIASVSSKINAALTTGAEVNLGDAKGYEQYFKNYLQQSNVFTDSERQLIQSVLPTLRDWYVQAGASGMNATDTQNRGAFMLGGTGQDTLTGGIAADLLVGNAGDDVLQGGLGNDTLLGGAGSDTYKYTTGDGLDTITDKDGQGSIAYDGLTLTGGSQYGDARVHRSADGKHLHVQVNSETLVIDGGLIVNDYIPRDTSGALGLNMTGAVAEQNPQTTNTITGDLAPVDTSTSHQQPDGGVHAWTDVLGNLLVNGAAPNRADTLYDSSGNDYIVSGGGDDIIYATRGGDDRIEAGSGRDSVIGGAGNDVILGGADGDILSGGAGNDRLYADTQMDVATAIAQGNSQTGIGQQGDWLAGGAGDDILVGSSGNDVLTGGGGSDLLIGGAGNDDILGDTDWTATSFNWTVTDRPSDRYFYPVMGTQFPADDLADVIYAGVGNDHAWGGIGNDVIFGEGGNDKLYGESGNDTMQGGAGEDWLYGEGSSADTAGSDYLDGGADTDVIFGGAGDDILIGGTGNDFLYGESGQDTYIFNRGDGNDTVYDLKSENNILRFGAGISEKDVTLRLGSLMLDVGNGDAVHIKNMDQNSVLTDFDRNDVFNSSSINGFQFADGTVLSTKELLARGFDLDGTQDNDTIYGTNTLDRIKGYGGNDQLYGGDGDDILDGGEGNDLLQAGAGNDIYLFNSGGGQDIISDTQGANALRLGLGIAPADIAFSRIGNDLVLNLKDTSDQLTIQNWGNDSSARLERIEFADGTVWDAAYVNAQALLAPILGTIGGDSLGAWIGEAAMTMIGGEGDDTYVVAHTTDVVREYQNEGVDTVISRIDYTLGVNLENLTLTGVAVKGTGNGVANVLVGNAAGNSLAGGAGDDYLNGDAGNDYLEGGVGNDILVGGAGADLYSLKLGAGHDQIESDDNLDSILFGAGITAASLTVGADQDGMILHYGNAGDDVRILGDVRDLRFADGTSLTLGQQVAAQNGYEVTGGSRGDFLSDTSYWARSITGGKGNDVLMGGGADTLYHLNRGDGQDSLVDLGGQDTLSFGSGIRASDIRFADKWADNTFVFKVYYGAGDAVTILNGGRGSIEKFSFGDGTVLSFDELAARQGYVAPPALTIGQFIELSWGTERAPGMVVGTAGADDIWSTNEGNDVYAAGKGNDLITISENDGSKQSKLVFDLGDGQDTLRVTPKTSVVFGSGIDPRSVTFESESRLVTYRNAWGQTWTYTVHDQVINYGDQGDRLTVDGQYSSPIASFEFADGHHYSYAQMQSLAMWFAPGGSGGSGGSEASVLQFNIGDGAVVINGSSVTIGGRTPSGGGTYNTVQFGLGIDPSMLSLEKGSLLIRVGDSGDELHITDFNPDDVYAPNTIQNFLFADGSALSYRELIDRGFDMKGSALDEVLTGTSTTDRIKGFDGNDILNGRAGDDILDGGAGNDTYLFGPGSGIDRVYDHDLNANIDAVVFADSVQPSDVEVLRNGEDLELHLVGSTDSLILANWYTNDAYKIEQVRFADGTMWDVAYLLSLAPLQPIVGTNEVDTLYSMGGVDNIVQGMGGGDVLIGSNSNDVLDGGVGDDSLDGGSGEDSLIGGTGNDLLQGGSGDDVYVFNPGDGVDIINEAGGVDTLRFAPGIGPGDIVVGRNGRDLVLNVKDSSDQLSILNWRDGNDYRIERVEFSDGTVWDAAALEAQIPLKSLVGTDESDYLVAVDGENTTLQGLAGDDVLVGRDGNDILDGGSGDDRLNGGGGNDVYLFGPGSGQDYVEDVDIAVGNIDTVRLAAGIVPADITVTRDEWNLYLSLNNGADQLMLSGWFYDDANKIERVAFDDGTTWEIADLQALANSPSAGDDFIVGTVGDDGLKGLDGNDQIYGLGGNDTLDGGSGDDELFGAGGSDLLLGGEGADYLQADSSYSDTTNDLLDAGAGNDDIDSSVANDLIVGGSGDDYIYADDGNDVILFNRGDGADIYNPASSTALAIDQRVDTISLGGGIVYTDMAFSRTGNDLVLELGNTDSMTFEGWFDEAGAGKTIKTLQMIAEAMPGYDSNSTETTLNKRVQQFDFIGLVDQFDAALAADSTIGSWAISPHLTEFYLGGSDALAQGGDMAYQYGKSGTLSGLSELQIRAQLNDGNFGVADLPFSIDVVNANSVPFLIEPLGNQSALEDQLFSFVIPANGFGDGDLIRGDVLTFAATLADGNPLPSWLSFDAATRTFSGTPGNGDVGSLSLAITVVDAAGASVSSRFDVAVANSNDAPIVVVPLLSQQAVETLTFTYVVPTGTFADVDVGDVLTLSATLSGGAALPSWLLFDAATQTLTGIPPGTSSGAFDLEVRATDAAGSIVVAPFSIDIANLMSGTANSETLTGTAGRDVIHGVAGNDTLRGGAEADALEGGEGNDRLDGGAGADLLIGGVGNDTYVVDDAGDVVTELAGEGIDAVQSLVSYTLGANVENLTLTGTDAISGTGNELNNVITGNAGSNTLRGLGGNDTLRGGAQADILEGGEGNDRLDGGAGADILVGGVGNDTYVVDDVGDMVTELAGEGIDTVQSLVSYTLGSDVENLTLTGTAAINGTGNELNNVITGNVAGNTLRGLGGNDTLRGGAESDTLEGGEGNDRLDGGAGADLLVGGVGNDTYVVDDVGDVVTELAGEGTDTVQSLVDYTLGADVENLTLTGTAAISGTGNDLNNVITGNAALNTLRGLGGNDTLRGGAESDTLEGGEGNDRLEGGLGADIYLFGRGDGQDTLVDTDASAGVQDVLRFGRDIAAEQIWMRKLGNNLEITLIGSSDKVTVSNWYLGADRHVEALELADGRQLLDSQVQSLVDAMAAFSPPAAGQTTLSASYASALNPVIAANWQ